MTSFWPADISQTTAKAPVTILKEQASFLGSQTKNTVEAKVEVNSVYTGGTQFAYDFKIVAPALGFSYDFFFIIHSVELYPVFFKLDDEVEKEVKLAHGKGTPEKSAEIMWFKFGQPVFAKSEEEFKDILKTILNSGKSKRVIRGIIAQVS